MQRSQTEGSSRHSAAKITTILDSERLLHGALKVACWLAVSLGLAVSSSLGYAATTVTGPVSGVWNEAGSPYLVDGDIVVDAGSTLVVQPGVQVRFQGPYILEVKGTLQATGASDHPIVFTRAYPNVGWNGIKFRSTSSLSSLTHCQIYGSVDSGIRLDNSRPTIRNCVIAHNSSPLGGGGINAVTGGGTLNLTDCVITNNAALGAPGGGGVSVSGSASILRCAIAYNSASGYPGGGGILVLSGSCSVRASKISDNVGPQTYGGGAAIWTGATLLMTNCVVRNNSATHGGSGLMQHGGGLATVANCTFAYNVGEACWGDKGTTIQNSICYFNNNGGAQIVNSPSIVYSDVQGGVWPGSGNISANPSLNPATLALLSGSPCIDAGHPNFAFNDTCFPPSLGGVRNDMGAFGGPKACDWALPPNVVAPPQSQAVFFSSNALFTVTATGSLPMSYQWLFNGKPIGEATATELVINNVQPPDGGSYSVVVSNRVGVVTSAVAVLTVPHATTATPTVVNGFVVDATITGGGFGYTNAPAVRFLGGGGSGAQAEAVVSNYVVIDVIVKNTGSGYTHPPLVVIAPPLILEPRMSIAAQSVITFTNLAIGTNYQLERVSGGVITPVDVPFTATSSTYTSMFPGTFATNDYRLTVTPAPIQAQATAQVVNGFVVGLTLVNGGSGYTASPQVVISGGGGSNATATASVAGGRVTGFTITNPGFGYTKAPNVVIDPPPSVSMYADSVAQVMRLSYEYLSPYDNYQLEFAPAVTGIWDNLGDPFTPTTTKFTHDIKVSGDSGFFKVRYVQ